MINVRIDDGLDSRKKLSIGNDNDARVSATGIPTDTENTTLKPFVKLFENSAGTTDMRVDGSTTPVDFYINSSPDGNRYIQTLSFTIADAGASLNEFGGITALTNGCDLIYQDSQVGDVIIATGLKSNFDFVQICNFNPSFGSGTASFLASNVVGASEAFVPVLDITDVFGMIYGLKIPRDTSKKLILRVNDDVTAIDRFDIKAFGFDRVDKGEK